MNIKLDKKLKKPLYLQLYDALAEEIRTGRLRNGTKLTPRRALAKQLGISGNTIDSAYKMLQDTGYVISIPRSGYTVSFKSMIYENIVPWETSAPEEIVFSPNGVDFSHMNRPIYAKTVRDLAYNEGSEIFSYVDKSGERELRNAISKYLYSFRNIKCSPDRIIVGAGAEYLLTALAQLFGGAIIMENPCDPHFYQALKAYGRKIELLPVNVGKFDADALHRAKGSLLFIDPYSRFPRGKTLEEAERREIIRWSAEQKERYIIENGDRAELSPYSGEPLYSAARNDRTIYLGSFSKSLCPAVKTSYMVLPEEILNRWKAHHLYYYAMSSKLEQYAVAKFIEKGYFTNHYKMMKRLYKEKLDYLQEHLESAFGDGVTVHDIGGTYLTAHFKEKNTEEIKILARRNGVKLMSESSFCAAGKKISENEDCITLGVGDLTREEIRRGILLLKRVFE